MYRIDTADNAAVLPAYSPVGTPGYFQDTELTGGTTVPAEWLNHVQEEIANCIEELGGTLDKSDDAQLWTVLAPRMSGIISDASDTGVVTTTHTRAVVAAMDCKASGQSAVDIASRVCEANGSACINAGCATSKITVSSLYAANLASSLATIDATRAATIASRNIENATDSSLALGYDGGAAITPSGSNQNISIHLKANGGHIHAAGTISAGGDVDAGTGATASMAGATGIVTASGGVDLGYGTGTCSSNAVTINEVSGLITTESLSTAAGAAQDIVLTNNKMDIGSQVYCSMIGTYGPGIPIIERVQRLTPTTATIRIRNLKGQDGVDAALNAAVEFRFFVVNPAV